MPLHDIISARCVLSISVAKSYSDSILAGSRRVEEILHHDQCAGVVLDHAGQETDGRIGPVGFGQVLHLLRGQHAGHHTASNPCLSRRMVHMAVPCETGRPRSSSHCFMYFISSDCEMVIRLPNAWSLLLRLRVRSRSTISTACAWCMDHALHETDIGFSRRPRRSDGGSRREGFAVLSGCARLDDRRAACRGMRLLVRGRCGAQKKQGGGKTPDSKCHEQLYNLRFYPVKLQGNQWACRRAQAKLSARLKRAGLFTP